jgi:hypothetical protein
MESEYTVRIGPKVEGLKEETGLKPCPMNTERERSSPFRAVKLLYSD